jgi:hypothetical protein
MLRAALTALVLASAVGCGSSASSGPAVVAGAPAGDVAEVSGTVTATRDGTPRPLTVGAEVSGDDVIETGADGRVSITLRHNRVAWSLGPGSKEQVGASLAWRAPTATQVAAGPTGERSGAAGRHAEREAAETAASAEVAMARSDELDHAAAAAPAPPRAAAPIAPPADLPAPGAAPTPPPPADKAAIVDDEAPAPRAAKESRKATAAVDGDLGGGVGLTGSGQGGGGGGGIGLGDLGTIGHGSGTGEGRGYGAGVTGGARAAPITQKAVRVTTASGGLDKDIVHRIVRSKQAGLYACHGADGGRTLVRLIIATDGKVTRAIASGSTPSVHTCMQDLLKKTSFPSAKATTTAALVVETAP